MATTAAEEPRSRALVERQRLCQHLADGANTSTAGAAGGAHLVYATGVSPKRRTVAAILGFSLGGLGVDRFYLGNIGMGVASWSAG